AVDERDALRLGRQIVRDLDWHKAGPAPRVSPARADAPTLDPNELLGLADPDPRVPFEVREVIWRIVDGSRFDEFKPAYGSQLVCGFAELCGYSVGIVANNGVLFSEESEKGAQ